MLLRRWTLLFTPLLAVRDVRLLYGKRTIQCRRKSTDACCHYATMKEFPRNSVENSSVESHGTQMMFARHGLVSRVSMITFCHDIRPDPLPDRSPHRILNIPITVYCRGKHNVIDIREEPLQFPLSLNGEIHRFTMKGKCVKDVAARLAYDKEVREYRESKIARVREITDAFLPLRDQATTSILPHGDLQCIDLDSPSTSFEYDLEVDTEDDSEVKIAADILIQLATDMADNDSDSIGSSPGATGQWPRLDPMRIDLNQEPSID